MKKIDQSISKSFENFSVLPSWSCVQKRNGTKISRFIFLYEPSLRGYPLFTVLNVQ